jgi:hypothetical protein
MAGNKKAALRLFLFSVALFVKPLYVVVISCLSTNCSDLPQPRQAENGLDFFGICALPRIGLGVS